MTAVILGILLTLTACMDDHGHKVQGDDLTVYFDRETDLEKATQVANFWKEKELLTGKPQDLKLSFVDSTYYLFVIANQGVDLSTMEFKERRLLLDLQGQLQDSLFKNNTLELVISDDHFKPLMNIND